MGALYGGFVHGSGKTIATMRTANSLGWARKIPGKFLASIVDGKYLNLDAVVRHAFSTAVTETAQRRQLIAKGKIEIGSDLPAEGHRLFHVSGSMREADLDSAQRFVTRQRPFWIPELPISRCNVVAPGPVGLTSNVVPTRLIARSTKVFPRGT